MKKQNTSPAVPIRLKEQDQAELEFIQKTLSQPGLPVNRADAVRRAIHGFAEQLRKQKVHREPA